MVAKTAVFEVRVATDWRAEMAAWEIRQGKSENTLDAHRCDLNVFCGWFERATGEGFGPEVLNSFDLARFRQWQLEVEGVKPATWNRRLATLRVLAEWMRVKTEIRLPADLFDGILPAAEMENPPDWLTEAEFDRLGRYVESTAFDPYEERSELRKVRALRGRAMAATMVYAGLREKEIADLTAGDVELGERKGKIVVRHGKGQKRREVPVDAGLRKILRRWVEVGKPVGYLFPNDTGGRLSERAIQEQVGEIGQKCGVDDLRAHRLRHTFGKRMADGGVAIQVIAALMGHSSLEVTRRYVQPGMEDLEAAVSLVRQGKMANSNERSGYGRGR